jgi:RES domain-containing protein
MASRFEADFSAFRIVRVGLPVFDGAGAFRWGGRWSSPGRYIIHAAESYSLGLLESMVHFNLGEVPPSLAVVPLRVPANVSREIANTAHLAGWDAPAPYPVSRQFGDAWYDQRRTAVLIVPSVLSLFECNILINQEHPEAHRIEVGNSTAATLDDRLRLLLGGTTTGKS